jgi:ABC-type transport system substrate-binding protein
MRRIAAIFFISAFAQSWADTQDYIRAGILLIKSDVVYFNVGEKESVSPGETFELYYDERLVATGKIGWADKNISRSEPLDSSIVAQLEVYRPLTAKIRLLVPSTSRGGHLNIPMFAEPHLEPATIATSEDMMIARLIHRGLVTRESSGNIVPDLCGDYEIRDLTYTFYLRSDAKFHSGKPIQSSDVLYSIEQLALASRLTDFSCFVLEIRGAREFRNRMRNEIAGIFIIDSKTISITLERSFPSFEEYLAGPAGYIIPRPGMVASGAGIVGAGPYKIKWHNSEAVVLEPFEVSAEYAFLDSLRFLKHSRIDEAGLSFELGRLDIMNLLGENPPKFVSKGNFTSYSINTNVYVILGINGEGSFRANQNFGRAISFLLDRGTLIRVILGGSASQPDYAIPGRPDKRIALSPPFMPDSADYYFDIAKHLPKSVSLYTDSRFPVLANIARYLIGQLQKQGIRVVERKVDLRWIEPSTARSDLDLYLTYHFAVSENPDCVLYPLLSNTLSGETNYLYNVDEVFQTFLENLHAETNLDKRDSIAEGLVKAMVNDAPLVMLFQPHLTSIIKGDIGGILQNPAGYVDLRRAFIEAGK